MGLYIYVILLVMYSHFAHEHVAKPVQSAQFGRNPHISSGCICSVRIWAQDFEFLFVCRVRTEVQWVIWMHLFYICSILYFSLLRLKIFSLYEVSATKCVKNNRTTALKSVAGPSSAQLLLLL